MKIYHDNRTRSMRVVWAAEEMGLDVEVVTVEMGSDELRAVNPMETLPAFTDGDVTMSESMAIVEYLERRYAPGSLIPAPEDPDFADYLQFSWLGEASLGALMLPKIINQFFAPDDQKGGWIDDFTKSALPKRIDPVKKVLKEREFVAGDRFTAADISVYYALNLIELVGLESDATPEIVDYRERMRARPAFLRAMER